MVICEEEEKEGKGRNDRFYLMTHSTHFYLRLHGVGQMVKDHSENERGNQMSWSTGGTRNISMGPPSRIDPSTHRTMSEHSYHGAASRSHEGKEAEGKI